MKTIPLHNQSDLINIITVTLSVFDIIITMTTTISTISVEDVVDIICDRFELETHDVLAYVRAMLACSSNTVVQTAAGDGKGKVSKVLKRLMPLGECEGCLFDPVTRKLYSEIAVD